jgi:transposase
MVMDIIKEKQKILSLVNRTGNVFDLTKSNWTKKHREWLRKLSLPSSTRLVLDCRLEELNRLEVNLEKLDSQLDGLMETTPRYKKIMDIYRIMPGIGRVGAMTLLLEGRDLKRFPTAGRLMNFTGLIPRKHSSSDKDPSLSITKAGNRYLRTAIVGAAKFFRDRRFSVSTKILDKLPERVKAFMQRCQKRLFSRYHYLRKKGKHSNKAKVAIARELCGFLWELMTKHVPRLSQEEILSLAAV